MVAIVADYRVLDRHGSDVFDADEASHGFFNKGRENDRWYTPTLMELDKFLTRLGYLAAPSTGE